MSRQRYGSKNTVERVSERRWTREEEHILTIESRAYLGGYPVVGSGYNTSTILSVAGAEERNPRVALAVRIDVRARRDSILMGFVQVVFR